MAIRIDRLFSRFGVPVVLLTELLAPGGLAGQEVIVPFQFSFSDPGARSMGFGGAFVALADDATAAFANPAGLVQLARPELSVEGRHWSYSTPFTAGGRVEGQPSGIGIDTMPGIRTARSEDELGTLSFLSVAYPRRKWSLAFFRHQLADFEFHGETQGVFGGGSNCCQTRIFDQRGLSHMELVSFGISGGYRISENVALGLGVVHHDGSFEGSATMFLPDDTPDGILGPTSFLPERSIVTERNSFDDTDWALTAGFLWRLSKSWTLGGVYREGPEFEAEVEFTAGEAGDFGVPPGGVFFEFSGIPIELPAAIGLGWAYRAPSGALSLSFQWDRIEYSRIVESLRLDDRALDDVDELHLGGEYVFLRTTTVLALRLGAWLDPDHQIRAITDDPLVRALLPGGDDEMHYAAGFGVALSSFQLDLGVDFSDQVDTVSLSAVYTF
jgi:long-subunit fatty acid transport protein